jgi:hypothetical protein
MSRHPDSAPLLEALRWRWNPFTIPLPPILLIQGIAIIRPRCAAMRFDHIIAPALIHSTISQQTWVHAAQGGGWVIQDKESRSDSIPKCPSCGHARGSGPACVGCRSNPLPWPGYLPRRRRIGPTRKGPGLRQRTRAYGGCAVLSVHHDDDPAPVTQRGRGFRLLHLQDGNGSVIDRAECRVIMCVVEKDIESAPIGQGADQSHPWVCQRSAPSQNRSHADQERPLPHLAIAAQYRLPFSSMSSGI